MELARLSKEVNPRIISDEAATRIVDKIKSFAGTPFAVASDPAAEYAFVQRVIHTIQSGGWKWTQYSEGAVSLPTSARGSGLQLRINGSRYQDFGDAAKALADALTQALGQSVGWVIDPPESPLACSPDAIQVEIYKVR